MLLLLPPGASEGAITVTMTSSSTFYCDFASNPVLNAAYAQFDIRLTAGTTIVNPVVVATLLGSGTLSFVGPDLAGTGGLPASASFRFYLKKANKRFQGQDSGDPPAAFAPFIDDWTADNYTDAAAATGEHFAYFLLSSAAIADPPGDQANGQSIKIEIYHDSATLVNRVYSSDPGDGGPGNFPVSRITSTVAASAIQFDLVSSWPSAPIPGVVGFTDVAGHTGMPGAAPVFSFTPSSLSTWPASAYAIIDSTLNFDGICHGSANTVAWANPLTKRLAPFVDSNLADTCYNHSYLFAINRISPQTTAISPISHVSSGPLIKHTNPSYIGTYTIVCKGDVNGDGFLSVGDVLYFINFLFAGGPGPLCSGDVNSSGQVNVSDVLYLINYLFAGGPPPI